jgi:hypothetical protein
MSLILDGTNGLSDVDGTAAAPAIRGTDANTGIFFGADIIGFSEGGAEAMRIDSDGDVGIGTSSPTNKLHVSSSGFETIKLEGTSTVSGINFVNSASSNGYIYYDNGPNMLFYTNGSERARIDSSGNLLVGTTSSDITAIGIRLMNNNQVQASKNNDWSFRMGRRDSTGIITEIYYNSSRVGDIATNGTGTAYNSASDYRLKEDIVPMTGALAKVGLLKPVTYKWKSTGTLDEGFIAHELAEVCPSAVTGEKDAVDAEGNPVHQGIDTSFLVATLTAALQEAHELIKNLEQRVAALEAV